MSDTPKTDAKAQFFGFNPDEGEEFVQAHFARKLERENYLRFIRGLALDALQTSKDTGVTPEEALANIIECIHQDTAENLEFLMYLTDDSDGQN